MVSTAARIRWPGEIAIDHREKPVVRLLGEPQSGAFDGPDLPAWVAATPATARLVARDLSRRVKGRGVRDAVFGTPVSMTARGKMHGPLRCTELAHRRGWRCVFAIELHTLRIVGDGARQAEI